MPRQCTVCAHAARAAIDAALVSGATPYELHSTYTDLSREALQRHKADHLPEKLLKAQEIREIADADRLKDELEHIYARINKLFGACDEWLTDADDPTRYDLGPRAHELKVTYEEPQSDGRALRRKATLAELLATVEDTGDTRRGVVMVETKSADPRDLILKTAGRLQGQLELVAKLIGELDERPQINLNISPEWLELRAVIVQALQPHPDALQSVLGALEGTVEGESTAGDEQW